MNALHHDWQRKVALPAETRDGARQSACDLAKSVRQDFEREAPPGSRPEFNGGDEIDLDAEMFVRGHRLILRTRFCQESVRKEGGGASFFAYKIELSMRNLRVEGLYGFKMFTVTLSRGLGTVGGMALYPYFIKSLLQNFGAAPWQSAFFGVPGTLLIGFFAGSAIGSVIHACAESRVIVQSKRDGSQAEAKATLDRLVASWEKLGA